MGGFLSYVFVIFSGFFWSSEGEVGLDEIERIGAGLAPPHRTSFFLSYLFVSSHLPSFGRWPKAEGIGVAGRSTQVVSLSLLEKGKMGPGVRGDNPKPTENGNMRLQNRNCVLPKLEEVFKICNLRPLK